MPILVFDCSGEARHRANWRIFYPEIDAIIYVIDATDTNRFYNCDILINEIIENKLLDKKKAPMVFLANKTDLDEEMETKETIQDILKLDEIRKHTKRKWVLRYAVLQLAR